jgi:hypothetical protein
MCLHSQTISQKASEASESMKGAAHEAAKKVGLEKQ